MRRQVRMLAAAVLCMAGTLSVSAQAVSTGHGALIVDQPGLSVRSRVDWTAGRLDVEIMQALDPSQAALPRAKGDAETEMQARLGEFMTDALSRVVVDSSHTYGNLLERDPSLFARVSGIASGATQQALFLSDDFSRVTARYSLPLFGDQGLASPLYPSQSQPLPRRLGWVPTRPFTGLLIYAKGMLPAVGTSGTGQARPALFPRLFDESMTVVMEKGMCTPQALAAWGMVGYAASLDDPVVLVRAGPLPLRLVARGVFGDNSTDIVIPTEGALQLLTLPENMQLLRDGKIVIVYDSLD
ncbi:MAG TPA: hypothetical protein VMM82_08145 [Spirochaetia bacterium]|nr:hypothetical protein [Spirochaetia bacterium]